MADDDIKMKNINDLSDNSSVNNSDNLMVGNAGTNSLRRLSLSNLFDAIKSRMTSWTFSGFNTSIKTITGAVNEIRSERVTASDFTIQSFEASGISCDSGGYASFDVSMTYSGYRLLAAWVRGVGYARMIPVSCYTHSADQYASVEVFVPSCEDSVVRGSVIVQGLFVRSS